LSVVSNEFGAGLTSRVEREHLMKSERKTDDRRKVDRRGETMLPKEGCDRRSDEQRGYADRRDDPFWKFRWLRNIISKQLSDG
jgi:hypothetical protein